MWGEWICLLLPMCSIFSLDLTPPSPPRVKLYLPTLVCCQKKRGLLHRLGHSRQKFTVISRSAVISSDQIKAAIIYFLKSWSVCERWWSKEKRVGEKKEGGEADSGSSFNCLLIFKCWTSFEQFGCSGLPESWASQWANLPPHQKILTFF